ncbi:filamentous hemagglutinin N-terminal domain-containing protein, partial [Rugamonas sp. FT82W]
MNKLCYRIVFNKARGLCMAVQETARSHGKGAGQAGPAGGAAAGGLATRLRSLARALLGVFGGTALLAGLASAQIVADPNASGRQQATVLNAANGVLQVNIQTPSVAGVSRNVYSRFDVPKTGAVLNNSRTAVQSQLGGWIDANPWMAHGTARVILNEVNSNDPSQLRGYIEVAGTRAETVIANAAGIVVDGAGFINVSRATLTTGKPLLDQADGALRGYAVRGGMISIGGAGLDARQADYTALIARSVQLNAGLWAQQLEVTTGVNDVALAADGAAAGNTATAVAAGGDVPRYGIDASQLGGMYANKITLVGTEAGVGVRNAGALGAAAGELIVTTEGRLENTGSLAASLALSATARDGVVNSGGMSAGGALSMSTPAAVSNSGTISGAAGLQLTAASLSNSNLISSTGRATLALAGDVDNSHGVIQAQSLALSSGGGINNQSGKLLQTAAVALEVTAAGLHNANGGQVGAAPSTGADGSGANAGNGADGGTGDAGTGNGSNGSNGSGSGDNNGSGANSGSGSGTGTGSGNGGDNGSGSNSGSGNGANSGATPPAPIAPGFMHAAGVLNNDGGQILSGGGIALTATSLDNTGGQMNLSSLAVNGGAFNNHGAQINVQRGASIHGTGFDNHDGKLVAGAGVDVQVQGLDNGNGLLSAGADLALDSAAIVNRDGKLVAGGRASITAAGAVDNHNGLIQAVTGLALKAGGKLDNQSGVVETIGAGGAMQVLASEIDNSKGRIANTGNGASSVGAAGGLLNTGAIGANGALTVSALTLQNQAGGSIQSSGAMALAVRQQLDNLGGITSGGALSFDESGATLSNAGQMAAGGDIHIAIQHAGNDGGQIGTAAASGASLTLSAADISNRGGSLLADRDVGVSAALGGLDNSKGLIHAGNDASVNAAQTLLNQDGVIEAVSAKSKLSLDTGAIQNLGGRIVNAGSGDSSVAARGAIVSDGLIAGNGNVAVAATTVTNSGTLSSAGAFKLAVTDQLDNSGLISSGGTMELGNSGADMRNTGQVYAVGDIGVQARNFVNAGQIATTAGGGGITLRGTSLDNHGGSIAASGAVDLRVDGALNNAGGLVQAGRDLGIAARGTLDNTSGTIEAIGAGSAMQVSAGAIVNVAGRIANVGSGDTAIAAVGDIQNSGLIAGNGAVEVTSYTLHNNAAGALTSGKQMTLAVEQLLQNDGTIRSAGTLDFTKTTAAVANSGSIIADGAMAIKAGSLVNDGGQISTTLAGGADLSIESQQLRNYTGRILAAGSAGIYVAGAVDNRIGVIQGGQGLSLNAGGALDNTSGTIEAQGAGSGLNVQANSIDNTTGNIVGAGSASVNSAGYIWNGGRIGANGKLDLGAASVLNTGAASITAGAGLGLSVRDLLDNHGLVSSYGLLRFDQSTGQVRNDGQIVSGGGINLKAGDLNNDKGQISTVKQSQTDVSIVANSASNQGGTIVGDRNAALTVTGALNNAQGVIQSGKDMQANVGAALTNTKGVIEATGATSALNVLAGSIDNTGGRIVNVGTGASSVGARDALVNGGLIAGNGGLSVTAATLQNSAAGTISAGKDLALGVSRQLDNLGAISSGGKLDFTQVTAAVRNGGTIVSGGAASISAGAFNNDGGQLVTVRGSGGDIALNAQTLSNRAGVIQSDRSVAVGVAYTVDNAHGSIQARQDLQFAAGAALNNNSGVIEAISAGSALRVQAASIDNSAGRIVNVGNAAASVSAQDAIVNSGLIAGNGTLDLVAGSLQNQAGGTVSSGAAMDLAVTQQLDNQGTISSGGTLEFSKTTGVVNNSGQMVAAGQVHVAAGALNNDGGQIATLKDSGASIAIDSQSLSNQGGSVVASGSATLAVAGAANNAHGTIQAQRDLQLTAGGALDNAGGTIEAVTAASSLTVQASAIDNSAGRLVNVGTGAATVGAAGLITNSGLIAGNGTLDLAADSLRNQAGGTVSSGAAMDLAVTRQLDNQGVISSGGTLEFSKTTGVVNNSAQMVAAGQVHVAAGALNNDGGQIATLKDSGASIAIDSQSLSNQGGSVVASGSATLAVAGAANNAHGTIQAQRDLQLTAGGALNNAGGTIEAVTAASTLSVQASAIDNSAGRLVNVGTGAATVGATGLITNSGLIAGNGSLDLAAGSLRNQTGGTVSSGQRMGLGVTQQLDNQGTINSGGSLTFSQTTAVVNNSGQIASAGQASIAAGSLNNDGGLIATLPSSGSGIAITSQSLSNHGGRVQASGDAVLDVAGALDNAQGTLQAGQDLRLSAGGTLSNNAGVIEALAAGSAMRVQAGDIANGSGRIVNVGSAATSVNAQGGISSSGTIAGNGTLDLGAQSLQNTGAISSGGQMTLSLSQLLDNHGAIRSGGALTSTQTTAQVNNNGTMVAGGAISMAAGNLNNDGGQIATLSNSGANIDLSSQSMSNRGGSVLASGSADVNVFGALNNAGGTLQAARDMQLTVGGALGNAGGVIEALSAGGTMTVQGQSIDNTSGRIVNVGSGDTRIVSQSTLVSSGMIAGNGNLLLAAQSAQNKAGGTLAAGGNLELEVTAQMQNQGTVSSAGTLDFVQSGASFSNSGQMISGGTVTFNAASFSNDGGQIATASASGADISVTSQSISNHGGKILASGDATLSSASGLDNNAGTLQAGKNLKLDATGALGNAAGTIEADGGASTLELTAATLDSSGGRIVNVGSGDTTLLIATDLVNSGLIAANGNLNLTAQTLKNNTGGAIGSAGNLLLAVNQQVDNHAAITSTGTLTFEQAGANLNNDGQLVAGGAMTIVAKAVNNNNGQIATAKGSGADLALTAASLSNEKGQILADGKAVLAITGALDNVQGTIQSGKDMQVNAGGALTNNGGAIEAAGAASALTLKALSIDNGTGRIVNAGSGDTSITSLGGVSNAGVIAGGGNLLLNATTLQNSATGMVASGKDMTLRLTQLLDNQGTINSAGTLTFNQAGANLNNSGLIVSGGNALIVANQINNNGGRLGTGAGSSGDLSLTTQLLSNEGGHITTGRDLSVSTHVMQGSGELQGGRDLALSMDGDYTQGSGTQQFHSNRDLSLTVTGNIVNTATFEAAGKLTLSGNNVSNNAGAVMQGQGVAVNAAGNLSNAGQINGTATVDLKSGGTLDNSNAIVGGNLTLEAQNLNNTGASTLLGSTGSMALAVAGTLNNTGGASIYSGGSLAIAGTPGGGATGLVNNMSSTIEAAGDLSLNAASVNNIRENVTLVKVQTVDETKQMYLPSWSHHGDNHNNYDPNSSNYVPSELYYVNPDDVLEDKLMFAPDGNMYGRAVIRTHANDSAFFWAASGAYSAQGERLRISMSDGTRVLYYMVRKDNMANPDQGGPTGTPTDLYLGAVTSWHSAPIAFSSQYGNCSTNCVRFETQPDYNDPTTEIIRVTARAVAPQSGKLEQSRLAHHTAEEDQIAPGSGAVAQILSGGNMHLTVGQALTNQYGQIMATGALAIDGGAAVTNQGATLYRNHTFDGTWKTDDGEVVAYTMPSQSEIIGSAAGVISGGKGVSITGRSFSNVDITAGTVGNIRDSVTVLPTGNNSASAASHATGNGASTGSAGGHVGGSGIGNNASGAN